MKARITSKGQLTLPKEVREALNVRPGDEVDFVQEAGVIRVRKHIDPNAFARYRGYLKEFAGRSTDDLMDELRGE